MVGMVYVMKRDEAEGIPNMVEGTLFIRSYPVTVLFDFGASHSFVTSSVIDNLKLVPFSRSPTICITRFIGDFVWC